MLQAPLEHISSSKPRLAYTASCNNLRSWWRCAFILPSLAATSVHLSDLDLPTPLSLLNRQAGFEAAETSGTIHTANLLYPFHSAQTAQSLSPPIVSQQKTLPFQLKRTTLQQQFDGFTLTYSDIMEIRAKYSWPGTQLAPT